MAPSTLGGELKLLYFKADPTENVSFRVQPKNRFSHLHKLMAPSQSQRAIRQIDIGNNSDPAPAASPVRTGPMRPRRRPDTRPGGPPAFTGDSNFGTPLAATAKGAGRQWPDSNAPPCRGPASHEVAGSRTSVSTERIVGRWRATSCQVSPSSKLPNTDPLLVPK